MQFQVVRLPEPYVSVYAESGCEVDEPWWTAEIHYVQLTAGGSDGLDARYLDEGFAFSDAQMHRDLLNAGHDSGFVATIRTHDWLTAAFWRAWRQQRLTAAAEAAARTVRGSLG